ncbi:MAG: hypothetical protein AAF702_31965 [Chloroflexota bacterium]
MRKFEEEKITENRSAQNQIKPNTFRAIWIMVMVIAAMALIIPTAWSSSRLSSSHTPITGWSSNIPSLPAALASTNAIAYDEDKDGNDDYIYLIGGRNNIDPFTSNVVHVGTIGDNGTIISWGTTSPLDEPVYLHSVSASDTHIYLVGGWKGNETMLPNVYRAQFMSGGQLGPWQREATDYPTKVNQHSTVIVNNRLYSIGGFTGVPGSKGIADVKFADINPDGTLGEWLPTTAYPFAVRRHAAVSIGNKIYVTGGIDVNDSAVDSIYVATVDQSNGTLSQWTLLPVAMPQAIFYHQAAYHDDKLVVMGGKNVNNGPDRSSVDGLPISIDGTLGTWQALPSMPKALFRFAAVVAKRLESDYLFILSGGQGANGSPTLVSDVYHSAIPQTPTATPTATSTPTTTPTPTPTVTPTPQLNVYVDVNNSPSHWIAPNEEITYVLNYRNEGPGTAASPIISATIPNNTEFISGSSIPNESSVTGQGAGETIQWVLNDLTASDSGSITYKVRRVLPTPGPIDPALIIHVDGPSSASSGQQLNYTLTVTNDSIDLDDTIVTLRVPEEAEYVTSSDGGRLVNDTIIWEKPTLPEGLLVFNFTLSGNLTFVIHEYAVEAVVPPPSGPDITKGSGTIPLTTTIDGLPPTGDGDGITILNNNVRISWDYDGNTSVFQALGVQNPSLRKMIFLPYLSQ